MPIAYICDGGCGHSGPKSEFKELGVAKKKIYCDKCAPAVETYLRAVNEAHTEAARRFKEMRDQAAAVYRTEHGGSLPDE